MANKILMKLSGINHLEWNGSARLQTPSGRQGATSLLQFDSVPLTSMYDQTPTGNGSKRVFVQDCFFEYAISNPSNALQFVDIYDVCYKREMAASAAAALFPEGAWQSGEVQQGNVLGSTLLGSYPTRVDLFKQYYKICKKESHILAPGDVHRHKIHVGVNRFFTGNRISTSARYAGITTASMIVGVGSPVDNAGTTTGKYDPSDNLVNTVVDASYNLLTNLTVGGVSTAPVALNIVWRARYAFRWIADIDNDNYATNALATIATPDVMQNTGGALTYNAT